MMIQLFFIISLVSSISCASVQDFCVADPKSPQSATGYSCKDSSLVTVDDFTFSAFRTAGNTSNANKAAITPAFAPTFAGINALGISVARADLAVGGVVPLHTHPGASEIATVVQGTIRAGFISSANKVYIKTLEAGDSIVFPQGLLHFLLNAGKGPAMAIFSFGSSSPTAQLIPSSLFSNDLPSDVVSATTFLSAAEVKRLKGTLGGTN